ncbi:hypothetical protein HanXRQr2_Chr05g0211921 [Helianthus annuus]|uniref:Secreted protein n=1 Tax=Helianthus annuus TaxID=4232 RepID=A0A9K3NMD5_HELAN|nr:hypothetical protein HanXRQr2_Chr05g0211921 [Helianthus annuus]
MPLSLLSLVAARTTLALLSLSDLSHFSVQTSLTTTRWWWSALQLTGGGVRLVGVVENPSVGVTPVAGDVGVREWGLCWEEIR